MRQISIEEKLEKALEFIKSIDKMPLSTTTTYDIIKDAHAYCDECGNECEVDVDGQNTRYVEANDIESLKDKAWHLLVDLLD